MAAKREKLTDAQRLDLYRRVICEQRDELTALYKQAADQQQRLIGLGVTISNLLGDLKVFREDYASRMLDLSRSTNQRSPSGRYTWDDEHGWIDRITGEVED